MPGIHSLHPHQPLPGWLSGVYSWSIFRLTGNLSLVHICMVLDWQLSPAAPSVIKPFLLGCKSILSFSRMPFSNTILLYYITYIYCLAGVWFGDWFGCYSVVALRWQLDLKADPTDLTVLLCPLAVFILSRHHPCSPDVFAAVSLSFQLSSCEPYLASYLPTPYRRRQHQFLFLFLFLIPLPLPWPSLIPIFSRPYLSIFQVSPLPIPLPAPTPY